MSVSRTEYASVALFCVATVLLIPLEWYLWGGLAWLASAVLLRWAKPEFRFRLGILLGCIALLTVALIHTERDNAHFLSLGFFFLAVVLVPAFLMHKFQPGAVDWRFWPRGKQGLVIFYTFLSIPLSWIVIRWYFFQVNLDLPTHWPMPEVMTQDAKWRLIIGINCVGIWDELFFVNVVYGILRTILPQRHANYAQAVVYTSVLYDMAFTGIGPLIIYPFALTQGNMYERSKCLFYVLIVHLIVDAFLVEAILEYNYPDWGINLFPAAH